jgi:hypothetical protein
MGRRRRCERSPFAQTVAGLQRAAFVSGAVACCLAALGGSVRGFGTVALGGSILALWAVSMIASVSRMCLPGSRRRHWAAYALGSFAVVVFVLTAAPELLAVALAVIVGLFYVSGALVATARIRREPHLDPELRRRQQLLVWCVPLIGFLIISAYYRHLDEPWVDDGFDAAAGGYD